MGSDLVRGVPDRHLEELNRACLPGACIYLFKESVLHYFFPRPVTLSSGPDFTMNSESAMPIMGALGFISLS